ncbi:hypothetical protein [Phenylobacterium sp.]|jgi:hypothetical protein|uniref:hypothetical protein n=1 Tax=Phenylobacterium sp. TaxID=1871053 RepID=UPI002F419890
MSGDLTGRLEAILRAAPSLMQVMRTGRDPDYGVRDYDLEDLFALRLRPNPIRRTNGFARTARSAQRRWPELTLVDDAPMV